MDLILTKIDDTKTTDSGVIELGIIGNLYLQEDKYP